MLQPKSKIKEIEYYIQQVEMLAMSDKEKAKISKIIALQDLINNESMKELIEEDLKDESWLESTNILINTCNKRMVKSSVLHEHLEQCKNFMVFRYIEEKLIYCKKIIIKKSPWEFKEVDSKNVESSWVNSKFLKCFEASEVRISVENMIEQSLEKELHITLDWMYSNKIVFFNNDIFEDIDFLIKKKKKK